MSIDSYLIPLGDEFTVALKHLERFSQIPPGVMVAAVFEHLMQGESFRLNGLCQHFKNDAEVHADILETLEIGAEDQHVIANHIADIYARRPTTFVVMDAHVNTTVQQARIDIRDY